MLMARRIELKAPRRSEALDAPPAKRGKAPPKTSRKAPRRKPSRRWPGRLFRWGLKWAVVAAIWGAIAAAGLVAYYAHDLPDIEDAVAVKRRPAVSVLTAEGSLLAAVGDLYGEPVRVQELPPHVPRAMLAIEDRRFYRHFGVDPLGLIRAAIANARAGRVVQGGSTITQQVAKNLFLAPDRTLKRKVQELLLALWLEHRFTKDQILTLYLNRVYLGAGTYGVDAAARRYFGRTARTLGPYEAAMLAGLLKAPSRFNPLNNPEAAAARTRVVLAAMVDAGFLESADVKPSPAAARALAAGAERPGRHFVDWVLEQVPDFAVPADRDLVITTTLDLRLQAAAEDEVEAALAKEGGRLKVGQAALVAMTPDGAVLAMVGGRDYAASQFNRATQAQRQPGSAFKPFVYLAGLEAGLTADTVMRDAPVTIGKWSPRNFNGRYHGDVTLTRALAESSNAVAVRVGERAGRKSVAEVARRLGVVDDVLATPALSLGAAETTLLRLTGGYAALAAGGLRVSPYAVTQIRDSRGQVLYKRSVPPAVRVAKASDASSLVRMMTEVVAAGTGKAAMLDRPAAGKTGTSQEFRDAWFMGFTADIVAGVWMGNDDGAPMNEVTGGSLPARTWRAFMEEANRGLPKRPLLKEDDLPQSWLEALLRKLGG